MLLFKTAGYDAFRVYLFTWILVFLISEVLLGSQVYNDNDTFPLQAELPLTEGIVLWLYPDIVLPLPIVLHFYHN